MALLQLEIVFSEQAGLVFIGLLGLIRDIRVFRDCCLDSFLILVTH